MNNGSETLQKTHTVDEMSLLSDDLLLSVALHPAGGEVVGLQGLVQRAVQVLLRLHQLVPRDRSVATCAERQNKVSRMRSYLCHE
jgi:hypothetical protein